MRSRKVIGGRLVPRATYAVATFGITIMLSGCPWFVDGPDDETWTIVSAIETFNSSGGGTIQVVVEGREYIGGGVSGDFASIILINGVPVGEVKPDNGPNTMEGSSIFVSYPAPRLERPGPDEPPLMISADISVTLDVPPGGGFGDTIGTEARFDDASVPLRFRDPN